MTGIKRLLLFLFPDEETGSEYDESEDGIKPIRLLKTDEERVFSKDGKDNSFKH